MNIKTLLAPKNYGRIRQIAGPLREALSCLRLSGGEG